MRLLLSTKVVFLWSVISCCFFKAAYGQDGLPKPFIDQAGDGLVYNTTFLYKDYQASGLLVVKKEEDNYHIVLLSKLGPTLMDFVITPDDVVWNKTIDIIEKPALKKALERDFRIILLTPLNQPLQAKVLKGNQFKVKKKIKIKIKTSNKGQVISAENRRFLNIFKSFVTFYYTNEDGVPDEICLTHRNIKLKIELKHLRQ